VATLGTGIVGASRLGWIHNVDGATPNIQKPPRRFEAKLR
jgi:hypothetical protein